MFLQNFARRPEMMSSISRSVQRMSDKMPAQGVANTVGNPINKKSEVLSQKWGKPGWNDWKTQLGENQLETNAWVQWCPVNQGFFPKTWGDDVYWTGIFKGQNKQKKTNKRSMYSRSGPSLRSTSVMILWCWGRPWLKGAFSHENVLSATGVHCKSLVVALNNV